MQKLGKQLEFISWIKRDGSGVYPITDIHRQALRNVKFKLTSLSVTYKTYIASEFNSFVVKIKD